MRDVLVVVLLLICYLHAQDVNISFIQPRDRSLVAFDQSLHVVVRIELSNNTAFPVCVPLQCLILNSHIASLIELVHDTDCVNVTNTPFDYDFVVLDRFLRNSTIYMVEMSLRTAAPFTDVSNSPINVFLHSSIQSTLYIVGSSLSALCCVCVFLTLGLYPPLRSHPFSIMFWRACCDFIFAVKLLIIYATQDPYEEDICSWFSSFVNQFAVIGSLSWFFILSLNLWFTVSNPFVNPKDNSRMYHIFVWSFTFGSSIVVALNHGYVVDIQLCWLRVVPGSLDAWKWLTFYLPLLFYWCLSVIILIAVWRRLQQGGFRETLQHRKLVLWEGRVYATAFSIQWAVLGWIYIWAFEIMQLDENVSNPALFNVFGMGLSLLGVLDFAAWGVTVYASRNELLVKSKTPKRSELSSVLRDEFVRFTVQGIEQSVLFSAKKKIQGDSSLELAQYCQEQPVIELGEEGACRATFKDSAPAIFKLLRNNVYGVSDDEYLRAFSSGGDNIQKLVEKFSEGKSGSFFYLTESLLYFVKTLTKGEHHFLNKILPQYYAHMRDNPNTLMCRFFGCHTITMYQYSAYFVVMGNVLWSPDPKHNRIHEKYDLKGSNINRHASNPDPSKGVLKDMDLNKKIRLTLHDNGEAVKLMQTIARDCLFFYEQDIMDYSLLLGIHNCMERRVPGAGHCSLLNRKGEVKKEPIDPIPEEVVDVDGILTPGTHRSMDIDVELTAVSPRPADGEAPIAFHKASEGGVQAAIVEGPGLYFMGTVDVLQEWNFTKKMERFAKMYFGCKYNVADGLSVIEPKRYAERFISAIASHMGLRVPHVDMDELRRGVPLHLHKPRPYTHVLDEESDVVAVEVSSPGVNELDRAPLINKEDAV